MTKRFSLLFSVGVLLLLTIGCSDSPKITNSVDFESITLVQRPEFIETRPQIEVEAHIMEASPDYLVSQLYKKPPKPDPGGDEDPNPNPAHKYAFVVGISDYEGTINDLQYCDDDAQGIRSMLQSEGFSVQMKLDRNATASAIVAGLEWLAAQAQPGDEIALYFSGHGNKIGSAGSSIITTDLYYISHNYVMEIINSANCSKILVTLDACKMGGFLSDGDAGSIVATASTNSYSYDAPDLHHGAYTYYFLEAANGDYVFAEDVADYAEDGMKAWAKVWGVRVSPAHTDKYTGKFDI